MSKLFVTGSLGFIGKNLVSKLKELGHEVYEHDIRYGSLTIPNALDVYYQKGIEHVFHLAARTFIPQSWNDPAHFMSTNVIGTQHVLEYCRKNNASLTYVSAYLYGNADQLPINEDCAIKPINPYVLSKQLAEQLCEFYADYYQLNVNILRPFSVYGPSQNERSLIPTIIKQVLDDGKIIRVKSLSPKRDYIYIDDLTEAFTASLDHLDGCKVYNIASGKSMSVKEVIDKIQEVAGTAKEILSDENISNTEIMDTVADISKAEAGLNWSPKVEFKEGIKKFLHTLKEQSI